MTDRQALAKWDKLRKSVLTFQVVINEDEAAKKARIAKLLSDPAEFSKYYFPNYCTAEFAPFQLKMLNKIVRNKRIYSVANWSREHAKSIIFGLFAPAYLMMKGELFTMIQVSHSYDSAVELLRPLIVNLESNSRLINDFGPQRSLGNWADGKWVTRNGVSFRAVGAKQSPRGTRNEEKRPDYIAVDDIDTDEEVRSIWRVAEKWEWVEQALFAAFSISGSKRFVWMGNTIGKDTCITRAMKKADFVQTVNIIDDQGKPSWPQKNSAQDVEYIKSKISYASFQKEYMNNPINEGAVFKDITFGKVPPLSKFKFLVAYCDPSYKDSKKNDFKAVSLIGELNGIFYVIFARLDQTSMAKMIDWFYDIEELVNNKTTLYNYIEEGGLQSTFYTEIFQPQLDQVQKTRGKYIPITPDKRSKSDKFTRIEALLEPLNRQGKLIFNEKYEDDPHMVRLKDQFKAIEPKLPAHDDGPDSVEGGVWIINNKLNVFKITAGATKRSSKKY